MSTRTVRGLPRPCTTQKRTPRDRATARDCPYVNNVTPRRVRGLPTAPRNTKHAPRNRATARDCPYMSNVSPRGVQGLPPPGVTQNTHLVTGQPQGIAPT